MVPVQDLYSDIIDNIPAEQRDTVILSGNILRTLTQVYATIRNAYLEAGRGDEFGILESFGSITAPVNTYAATLATDPWPHMPRVELSKRVLMSRPIREVVRISKASRATKILADQVASYAKDDTADRHGFIYVAEADITNLNTYNATYKPEQLKDFRYNNGMRYQVNDVVEDPENAGHHYVCQTAHTNQLLSNIAADTTNWRRVYWRWTGQGPLYPVVMAMPQVDYYSRVGNALDSYVIPVGNRLYVSPNVKALSVIYVPEIPILVETESVPFPDSARSELRMRTLALLIKQPVTAEKTDE